MEQVEGRDVFRGKGSSRFSRITPQKVSQPVRGKPMKPGGKQGATGKETFLRFLSFFDRRRDNRKPVANDLLADIGHHFPFTLFYKNTHIYG